MSIRDVMMIQDMGMVKSVQRGEVTSGAQSNDLYVVYLSPVDVSKSIVILNSGFNASTSTGGANGKLQSSTQLYLYHNKITDHAYAWEKLNWQVIEFY